MTSAMKRTVPLALDISSDDDDDEKPSPSNGIKKPVEKRVKLETSVINPTKKVITQELLMKSAKMYQDYMKEIPIPAQRESIIPFRSWTELANSMKQMYKQPLHYLTNIRMKEWDQMRNVEDEALDAIIHPCKAETNIWLMEEVHRLTSSHEFLAKLWIDDPMYYTFIDSVFPQL